MRQNMIAKVESANIHTCFRFGFNFNYLLEITFVRVLFLYVRLDGRYGGSIQLCRPIFFTLHHIFMLCIPVLLYSLF